MFRVLFVLFVLVETVLYFVRHLDLSIYWIYNFNKPFNFIDTDYMISEITFSACCTYLSTSKVVSLPLMFFLRLLYQSLFCAIVSTFYGSHQRKDLN